jgi:hypothetical protein
MGKVFIPRNIVMFAFMAVYHFVIFIIYNLGLICYVVYIIKNKNQIMAMNGGELSEG